MALMNNPATATESSLLRQPAKTEDSLQVPESGDISRPVAASGSAAARHHQ